MRILTIALLFFFAIPSRGQFVLADNTRFLTYEENRNWLTNTISLDKFGRWTAMKARFFLLESQNIPVDSIQFSPLIVINGVQLNIPNKLSDKERNQILDLLNEDSIQEVLILDKLSDGLILCRPFSGVIILKVDRKTDKRLSKLKLG